MGRSVRIALRLMAALGQIAAPALAAQAVFSQSVSAQVLPQPSLPPPPYASAMARPASYGGVQGYDRYGGGSVHARTPAPGAPEGLYSGPRLAWAGKAESRRPQRPQPMAARYAPPQAQPQLQPQTPALPPAPQGWTYVPPIGARPVEPPPPTPSSIYDAPPPVRQVASASPLRRADGVRHYSLHADFGVQPDPIPPPAAAAGPGAEAESLPAAFFGQSPDLSAPETPDPQKKVATANGKSRNPLQPEGGQ